MVKSPSAFRTISEVASELDVPQHVLRFWESKFTQVKPMKRGGGRRYYRPEDVELLRGIRSLLYDDGYTIKGVQKVLRDKNGNLREETRRPRSSEVRVKQSANLTDPQRRRLESAIDELHAISNLLKSLKR
ncbi:MAG: MerR family transcriptional regulator [Proteobacteria bacterium]|nr:MerR family transcriptional regulator [Pseudomonadota bacterium]